MSNIVEKETAMDSISNPSLEGCAGARSSVTLGKEGCSESYGKGLTPMQDDHERRYITFSANVIIYFFLKLMLKHTLPSVVVK